ncbi:MAG: RNA polymerase sigma factor [Planctomycetota bacterium]
MLKSTPEVSPTDSSQADSLTLRELFEGEESNLLRYAFSLTGRRAVAEEIVQDVFLQLHARWSEVESPKAWLFRSVRNRAFNHLRKSKREVLQSDDEVNATTTENENAPEEHLSRMETAAALRQMLDELSETDRQLVKLKYFEGLKYREISERTGLSISNVGYRLHHILKHLASRLDPLGIDTES